MLWHGPATSLSSSCAQPYDETFNTHALELDGARHLSKEMVILRGEMDNHAVPPAASPPPAAPPTPPHALRNALVLIFVAEVVGAIVFFIAFSTITGEPATKCAWCSVNGFDLALRKLLLATDYKRAGAISHNFSIEFLPLFALACTVGPALMSKTKRHFAAQDASIIIAAFLWVTAITDGIKKIASRERPGFHFGEQALTEAWSSPSEQYLSFFSGDTAWAFVFAACGTMIAYQRGYRTWRVMGIVGFMAAITAGSLRIAANMHWPTDVIMGATVGTLIGAGLPYFLHRRALAEVPL